MYSQKQVKALEKAMGKGLKRPRLVKQEAQGNASHMTLTIEANGQMKSPSARTSNVPTTSLSPTTT